MTLALIVGASIVGDVAAAASQSEIAFTELGVDLWPEYDRPQVLVIYRMTLAPGVRLPATIVFEIPAAAGDPSAVAEQAPDGRLVNAVWRRTVEGDRARVEVEATRQRLQLEYYDPALDRDGAERSFRWVWSGPYDVAAMSVQVQQPVDTQRLVTRPPVDSETIGPDGLRYHELTIGSVPAEQEVAVEVEYVKASDALSASAVAAAATPEAPTGASGSDDGGLETSLVVAIVFLATAIGALAVWAFVRRKPAESVASAGAAGPATTPGSGPGPGERDGGQGSAADRSGAGRPEGAAAFCTSCGAAAAPDDRFCHACGQELKRLRAD